MDREEITQAALIGRSRAGGLQVKFPDINITVAPDKQSAVADLTVEANISGEHDSMVQEMKFTLQKTDGQWLITRVETVRTLSWGAEHTDSRKYSHGGHGCPRSDWKLGRPAILNFEPVRFSFIVLA